MIYARCTGMVCMEKTMKKQHMKNKITESRDLFSNATGLNAVYLKTGARSTAPCDVTCCPFNNSRKCSAHIEAEARMVKATGKVGIIQCRMGLKMIAAPFYSKTKYKGAFLTSPFFIEGEMNGDEYSKTYKAALGVEAEVLADDMYRLGVFDENKINAYTALMDVIIRDVEREDDSFGDETEEELHLDEEDTPDVHEIRENYEHAVDQAGLTTYQLEAAFSHAMASSDGEGAMFAVRQLMTEAMVNSDSNIEIIRYRAMELAVLMSRTRANKDNVFELFLDNVVFFKLLQDMHDVDHLTEAIVAHVGNYVSVTEHVGKNINYTINAAKEYIRQNCKREVPLREVAERVYLSPSYFSRIFKQKTGERYIDFFNRVRIEESLVYLKDLKIDLSQIAAISGFSDQSYYTKVFKKFMGVSPNTYRKNYKLESAIQRHKERYAEIEKMKEVEKKETDKREKENEK